MSALAAATRSPSVLHQLLVAVLAGVHGVARLAVLSVRAAAAVLLSRPGRLAIVALLVALAVRQVRSRLRARRTSRRATR